MPREPKMKKPRLFQLYLEGDQYEALQDRADKLKRSIASVVREILDENLKCQETQKK